ncbi:MAG: hypothetical protein OXJ52_01645 [Oligoflexia bacterium]|nr:hypothetical protein [Oligoflexia bacterium]
MKIQYGLFRPPLEDWTPAKACPHGNRGGNLQKEIQIRSVYLYNKELNMSPWLSLQEYSYRKGISVSTLRRKIKNEDIEYKLKKGRYFLKADLNEKSEEKEKSSFRKKLQEKELLNLKYNNEDLMNLVHFLETEKQELLKYIENELTLTP